MISSWMVGFFTIMVIGCGGNNGCDPGDLWWLWVSLHPQETSQWCWAASAQMVMDYLGYNTPQCTQANNRFHRSDCCISPVHEDCIRPGNPDFGRYGFDCRTSSSPLSWNRIKEEISSSENCKETPFCFLWSWSGGGGHYMVVYGYIDNGPDDRVLAIINPSPPNIGCYEIITYEYYKKSKCHHEHARTYYDIEYTGGP